MANKTHVSNLKTWIKETLSFSKAIGVITENALLLKTDNNSNIKWE